MPKDTSTIDFPMIAEATMSNVTLAVDHPLFEPQSHQFMKLWWQGTEYFLSKLFKYHLYIGGLNADQDHSVV